LGALAPFGLFVAGVAALGLSGAPDERGFWPVTVFALVASLLLARDRTAWSDAVLRGMSDPVVAIMIAAWLFAGCLGALLGGSGFVEALVWAARQGALSPAGYVAAAFLVACGLSTATGTSLGTLLVCGPLLHPAGVSLGADPALLMGAVLAGATFGDSLSPLSDTTIASALTQGADIPGVVKARLKYALPAAAAALLAYLAFAATGPAAVPPGPLPSPRAWPMVLVPLFVVGLLLRRRSLVEALLLGIAAAVLLGVATGLLPAARLFYVDPARFGARGLLVEGLERGVGISVFTLLLMGLVGTLREAGLVEALLERTRGLTESARRTEALTVALLSTVAAITTHGVVAILAVGPFVRETGERAGLSPYRRANLLDLTACTWPFLLPFCIPTILAASAAATGGAPLSPLAVGVRNAYSWALVVVVALAVLTGFGRHEARKT
jgi:Na+/H+ antiporter NhaC